MTDKLHYLYRLIPPRPSFFVDQSDDEQQIMGRHVEYWTANLAAGKAVVFGPVLDGDAVWGLGVIEVDSEADAQALRDGDPAVTSGLGRVEILPMLRAVVRPLGDEPLV